MFGNSFICEIKEIHPNQLIKVFFCICYTWEIDFTSPAMNAWLKLLSYTTLIKKPNALSTLIFQLYVSNSMIMN